MEAVGLFDYQKLLEEADAITDDLDARYAAYAKADAWIIENAFAISVQCTAVANTVTRSVPFVGPYSIAGQGGNKFKLRRVQKDIVTSKDYYAAKEAWLKERAKSASK